MTNDADRQSQKPRCEGCDIEIASVKRILCSACLRERCRACLKRIDEVSSHGILCRACLDKLPDKERRDLFTAYGYAAFGRRQNALMALGLDYDRARALARGTVADPNAEPRTRSCHCGKDARPIPQGNLLTNAQDSVCDRCGAIIARGEAQPRRGRRMAG